MGFSSYKNESFCLPKSMRGKLTLVSHFTGLADQFKFTLGLITSSNFTLFSSSKVIMISLALGVSNCFCRLFQREKGFGEV